MIYFTLLTFGLYGSIGFFTKRWSRRWAIVALITLANIALWRYLETDIVQGLDETGAMTFGYRLILAVMEVITLGTFAIGSAFGSVMRERQEKNLQLGVSEE